MNNASAISKVFLIPLLAAITAITPLAIDMYLPALKAIAGSLNTDVIEIQQSLSTYLAGYAVGLMCFGYLADKLGRRPLVIFGLFSFSIISFFLSKTTEHDMFFLLRFLQAFAGSAATVVIPGYIKDIYGKDTAKGLSYVRLIMMGAPLVAPALGTFILQSYHWHMIFIVLAIYSALMFTIVFWKLKLPSDKDKSIRTDKTLFGAYYTVLNQKEARPYIACSVLSSLAFFGYLTASSFILMEVFGVSAEMFALLFSLNVGSLMAANILNSRLSSRFGAKRMLNAAAILGIVSGMGMVLINLIGTNYIGMMAFTMPFLASLGIVSVSCDALVLMKFHKETGSASAVVGTLRFAFGALAGPILAFFYTGTAMPFSMLVLTTVILIYILQLRADKKTTKKALAD
ncbi:multidrug effflux MFS transporter [Parashewanella tropica]|uniref:multidrug effflux MFS transporter n=1 Tax=Parashewanella tropica TaxID=2547970 RepID=UPI00105A0005|nr:multidrug effflux MFS transporter [Parashewanella tropica]